TGSVSVSPASVDHFVVAGFPSPVYAGTSGTFTVTAKDQYGNTVASDNDTITFSSTDTAASLPAPTALRNGTSTFTATLNTVGTQSLPAADAGGHTGGQGGIVVNAAPSTLTFNSPDVPAPLVGGYTTVSSLNVPSSVTIANLAVKLSVTYPRDGNL